MHVNELALSITSPLRAGAEVLPRLDTIGLDVAEEEVYKAKRNEEKDMSIVDLLSRLLKNEKKKLDEKSVCNMVESKLILVAFFREGGIGGYNVGVIDKNVECKGL